MSQIEVKGFKLLLPPAEPAEPNAFYLIQRDAASPVEMYVTDEAGNVQGVSRTNTSPILLASVVIDLNEQTAAKQAAFTVPASRKARITQIEPAEFTAIPAAAEISAGWNTAGNNLLDPIHLPDLVTKAGVYASLMAHPGEFLDGTAAQVLGFVVSTPEGSALTARFNVWGYLTAVDGGMLPNV